jgi:creatinine amidohydrolase
MREPRELMLADLSWTEVRELLPGIVVALIPTGSTEQHGPAMALKTDIAIATGICRLVSSKLHPSVVVAPPVVWGISAHHLHFPGTITLGIDLLVDLLEDIVRSLMHHGLTGFMFVNGHGGNNTALQVACTAIKRDLSPRYVGFCFNWNLHGDLVPEDPMDIGHGCQIEASYGRYLGPEMVKPDRFVPARYALPPAELLDMQGALGMWEPCDVHEYLPLGFKGQPEAGTYDRGRELVEGVSDRLVRYIQTLLKYGRLGRPGDRSTGDVEGKCGCVPARA